MTLTFIFFGSLMTAFSGAVAPGPLLAITLADARKHGPLAGIRLINGHAVLELLLLLLIILGPGEYLKTQPVIIATGLAGGLILLFMGIELIRSAGKGMDERALIGQAVPEVKGAVTSLSNPYWLLWWVTIGAAFLSRSMASGVIGVVVFFLGHILADYIWYGAVGLVTAKGNLVNMSWYRWIEAACGLALILFAGYFFIDALERLGII